ncbi:hypothetical protein N658DRAFT_312906 [Parathielavia hyrcaniae]|uniref:Uncharacterized protein n=1 Tax=Parathielavia hyrcaniae TaxID=113614 RepID=A0AAN6PSW0_9PEZI|nr:hypothetical protein N658DRAFT_312906 [Parathielavia hyrcaniae]
MGGRSDRRAQVGISRRAAVIYFLGGASTEPRLARFFGGCLSLLGVGALPYRRGSDEAKILDRAIQCCANQQRWARSDLVRGTQTGACDILKAMSSREELRLGTGIDLSKAGLGCWCRIHRAGPWKHPRLDIQQLQAILHPSGLPRCADDRSGRLSGQSRSPCPRAPKPCGPHPDVTNKPIT